MCVYVFGKNTFGRQEATRFNNHATCSEREVQIGIVCDYCTALLLLSDGWSTEYR